jgi:Transposase domain (DUF772)
MLLQAHEGLSDREAVEHLAFDLRWKAAAGLAVDAGAFHCTVLVGVRNRLRKSDRPRRLFDDVKAVAKAAGLLRGRNRVLDSTPVYDAVSTQDTVTQLRAVIRKVLTVADREGETELAAAVRAVLTRDDDRMESVLASDSTPRSPSLPIGLRGRTVLVVVRGQDQSASLIRTWSMTHHGSRPDTVGQDPLGRTYPVSKAC